MRTSDIIEHQGVVQSINKEQVVVELQKDIPCQSCQIKDGCTIHYDEKRTIEVSLNDLSFEIGEPVKVLMEGASGRNALLLGYVYPFLVLMITMLLISAFSENELIIGMVSLASLLPYYGILYLLRNKFKKKFKISIAKINS